MLGHVETELRAELRMLWIDDRVPADEPIDDVWLCRARRTGSDVLRAKTDASSMSGESAGAHAIGTSTGDASSTGASHAASALNSDSVRIAALELSIEPLRECVRVRVRPGALGATSGRDDRRPRVS